VKFWYAGVPVVSGGFGRSSVARGLSVVGSITRACGGRPAEGQTDTMRPWLSNASVPHREGGKAPENATSDRPSGPRRW
jgi:hypothetical protein